MGLAIAALRRTLMLMTEHRFAQYDFQRAVNTFCRRVETAQQFYGRYQQVSSPYTIQYRQKYWSGIIFGVWRSQD